MELGENSGLQDGHHVQADQIRADGAGTFGVKVQVQGIQGRPYVVLNGQGPSSQPPVNPDMFFMESSCQEYVSAQNGNGSCIQRPPVDYRLMRQVHRPCPEVSVSSATPYDSMLNYQRQAGLLRTCDSQNHSLNLQNSCKHITNVSHPDFNPFSTNVPLAYGSNVMVKRARIPLPGPGTGRAEDQLKTGEPTAECVPCRPSHIVSRLSVPFPGNDQRASLQWVGRVPQRNQMNSVERRQSQKAGQPCSGESSRTCLLPARVHGLGNNANASPALATVSMAQNDSFPRISTEESIYDADIRTLTAAQFEIQHNEKMAPRPGRSFQRMESGNPSQNIQQNVDHSGPEREVQVTPDILKGQQELLDQSDEDATKLVLFNYFKDGSGDGDEIIRQKVNLLFEKIQMLKSCAFQNVEELSVSEAQVKELQDIKEELESKVTELKQQLEEEIKNRESLSAGSENSAEELRSLQDKLSLSEQEQVSLRLRLTDMEKELQASMEKALQVKRERERLRAEAKSLQQQLSDMHDELDSAKNTEQEEKDSTLQELANLRMEFQELQQVHEEQEEILRWKERELTALKGAVEEEISAHVKEVDMLKEHHKEEVQKLIEAAKEAEKNVAVAAHKKMEVEACQRTSQAQVQELTLEKELLLSQVHSLKTQITTLNNIVQQSKSQEKQLRDRLDKLMEEKQRLEEEFSEARQQEEDMCGANRALTRHLEDTQSELTRLNQEHRQLREKLKEEERQVEELIQCKRELAQERRTQDRAFDKLQEEIKAVLVCSERETQKLQNQVDEARDQSSNELSVLRTQLHNTESELEMHSRAAQESKKELRGLEAELARCEAELEQAELKCKQLEMRVELQECSKATQDGRDRQVKLMEVRVAQLEEALEEERSSGDLLLQKMETVKDQVELARAELLQERAIMQDLECDKISLERQNKDLKSRVSYLEGSQKSGQDGLVSKLELRIQELEERLIEEERDSNTLQQANRKLERKMKEMALQVKDEQLSMQNQRDQLTLRLKTLKRQLDEAEEEIERLENCKKRLLRELDEQQEIKDQLRSQFTALRAESRHKKKLFQKEMHGDDEKVEEGNVSSE